jgi:TRAP-type uncharacterized transport system substrate-binding protein
MERQQYEQIAIGAGLIAILAALAAGKLPRWLRIIVVAGGIALIAGAASYGYRTYTKPVTLTVAVGSLDGEAPKIMSALATRLAASASPVRLKVLDKPTALEAAIAFASGEADLTILRADVKALPEARAVVLVAHGVVLFVGLPGTSISEIDNLKGKTVGVIGLNVNQHLIETIKREYDLGRAKVTFRDVPLQNAAQMVKSKQVHALLVVTPISDRYLAMLRTFWPRNAKMELLEIGSAGAIAAVDKSYESYDLPKGTIWGSPAVPSDDLTTLRVPLYLVANRKLSDDTVTALTKAMLESRGDLVTQFPLLAQMASPGTDKDAFIPIHPGAAAYFDGDQKTFFDKYGDQIFYGSMLLGTLTSILAGAWKFMTKKEEDPTVHPLRRLHALVEPIEKASNEADLAAVERSIDEIIKMQIEKPPGDEAQAANETASLSLIVHRLEHLIGQRRVAIGNGTVPRTA